MCFDKSMGKRNRRRKISMKLSYVITFIAAIGFTIAGSYFYRLIPEYESVKKEENAESKEAVETEESKEHKEVKK